MQVQLCAPSSGPISSNTCYHMTVGTSTWLSPRKGVLFYNSFPQVHGTMTADRGARQTARGPPPTRLVAPPTPPRPEMGRPPSLCAVVCRVEIQTRAQPGHAGPGFRISTAELSGNHPNGAPPAGVLRGAAASPLGCAEIYTVIDTCRFRAAAAREGSCRSPPRPGRPQAGVRADRYREAGTHQINILVN